MPLYSLVPSFRPLLAPVPRLRLRTDTHTHTHTQTDTHTQDNYRNPPAHACRGLIINPRRACAARVTVVVLCVCSIGGGSGAAGTARAVPALY